MSIGLMACAAREIPVRGDRDWAGWFWAGWWGGIGRGAAKSRRIRFRRGGLGAGAWMRFFVAEGAPQNDGGFMVEKNLWWRFALDELVACVAAEKRWPSHRTYSGLGGNFV